MQLELGGIHAAELRHMAASGQLQPLVLKQTREVQEHVEQARQMNREHGIAAEPMFRGAMFYEDADGLEMFHRHQGVVYGASKSELRFASMHFNFYLEGTLLAFSKLVALSHAMGIINDQQLQARLVKAREWTLANARQ